MQTKATIATPVFVFFLTLFGVCIASEVFCDTLTCGSSDRIEKQVRDRTCGSFNYDIFAPCDLPVETVLNKCRLMAPANIAEQVQKAENLCQDQCADYAAITTAQILDFKCVRRPSDVCPINCRPGSQRQSESCNVTIKREADFGTPTTQGLCKYVCTNRFLWDFAASISRSCSECAPQ